MTRQEAISTGRGLSRRFIRRGPAFLVIGRWEANGEHWCQAGAPTEEAAMRALRDAERDNASNPWSRAIFEVVAI